jgi:CO/xanthine dehydrogenase Mo-binding subunit
LIATVEAGIVLGYAKPALTAVEFPLAAQRGTTPGKLFEPTIWYSIDRDGGLTVNIIRAEMGQHVGTALARIVADELEADWNKVSIAHVDTDPRWGEMVTGGSWSVWQSFPLFSRAGAAGRIVLIEEGAKLLGVDRGTCVARGGAVVCGGQSIAYGDIVARGDLNRSYTPDQLQNMPIKPAAQRVLIGRDATALDIPAKVNGEARYGIDARVDGMIYARPKVPPTRYDCKVVSIDDSAAKTVPGYIKCMALDDPSGTAPGWVMVYADSFMAASHAADLVRVEWSVPRPRMCRSRICSAVRPS